MHEPTTQHDEHDDRKATMVFSPEFIVTIRLRVKLRRTAVALAKAVVPSWASCLRSCRRRVQRPCIGARSS